MSLISHWGQFKHYILSKNPLIAAVQETLFKDADFTNYTLRIPGYSFYTHNINDNTRKGGTALLVSNNLLHHQIDLHTELDAVGVNVKIANQELTLISLYLPPSTEINVNALSSLLNTCDTPVLIMGDFNAHHQSWGCNSTSQRGKIISEFLEQHDIVYLENQTPIHRGGQVTYSAIDLALATPRIAPLLTFNVQSDPHFSDHYPIHIELQVPSGQTNFNFLPRWNLRNADWSSPGS